MLIVRANGVADKLRRESTLACFNEHQLQPLDGRREAPDEIGWQSATPMARREASAPSRIMPPDGRRQTPPKMAAYAGKRLILQLHHPFLRPKWNIGQSCGRMRSMFRGAWHSTSCRRLRRRSQQAFDGIGHDDTPFPRVRLMIGFDVCKLVEVVDHQPG